MKKYWNILLSLVLGFTLCACSSSGKKDDMSADEEKQTAEKDAQSETEEPEAQSASNANYTDSSSFAGLDSYTVNYEGTMAAEDCVSGEVIFGETLLKDHYTGIINETEQLDGVTHEETDTVEMIEQGKAAKVTTAMMNAFGKEISFYVFNNTNAPVKPEDCVIIGIQNESAKAIAFKGGIVMYQTETARDENPAESLTEVLGEAYEMDADDDTPEYVWRDQTGDHIFELDLWASGGMCQTLNFCYVNYAAGK